MGVEIYELCGDAHIDRKRERERVGSRLCFFYSSVIKQFNITNTGLDNTSTPMGMVWVRGNHPRQPLLRLVHHPLLLLYLLSLGTRKNVSFYFVLLLSLFFLIA